MVNETNLYHMHAVLKSNPKHAIMTYTGKLPLHIAAANENISFECLKLLLDSYPYAAVISDNSGK